MPCPWYREGVCTSPMLDSPSNEPVIPARCLGDENIYRTCRYYKEPGDTIKPYRPGFFGKPLLLIHSISRVPRSECDFFVVEKHESGCYLAACKVLGRYLTRYEVALCESHWDSCPYRRVGHRTESMR